MRKASGYGLNGALRIGVTLGVIAVAGGLVAAGRSALADRAAAVAAPSPAPLVSVRTARVEIVPGYALSRRFAGEIAPARRLDAAFEEGGTVIDVFFEEGAPVTRGDVLARLDTRALDAERRRLRASRDALTAEAELARRTAVRQSALQDRGVASAQARDDAELGLSALEARIGEVEAALDGLGVRLDKSAIRAPFDGVVAGRMIDPGTVVAAGQPVLSLAETAGPQFRAGLPEALASVLNPDVAVAVTVGGRDREARLAAILPELEAATRTVTAIFDLAGPDLPAFRQSGTVTLHQEVESPGAWLPISALEDGTRGLWRVLTLTEDGRIGSAAVEILHVEGARAFVRGTFRDGDRFVTDGAHRVVPGQLVATGAEGA